MNKFKRWLIHKLGGFTVQERIAHEVVRSTAPIVRLSEAITLPNRYLERIPALDLNKEIDKELGHRLGEVLIRNNCVDIQCEYDEDDYVTIIKGTIYVAKKTS